MGLVLTSVTTLGVPMVSLAADSEGSTVGTVELEPGKTGPVIVDPEEEIGDGEETKNEGPLTIDYVPNFRFGSVEINDQAAVLMDQNPNPFVQVTDKSGSGAGWSLKLAATRFNKVGGDETEYLRGTTLEISSIQALAVASNNPSAAPETSVVTFGTSDAAGKDIMVAKKDAGMGSWKGKFQDAQGDNSVKLTIPTGNKAGNYSSTLTWSLSVAPE